jgi:mRNA-degrading endonuclease YafQ of YafQ-DinJ toxin-antitoxin module
LGPTPIWRDCHIKPDLVLIYRKVDPKPKAKPTLDLP